MTSPNSLMTTSLVTEPTPGIVLSNFPSFCFLWGCLLGKFLQLVSELFHLRVEIVVLSPELLDYKAVSFAEGDLLELSRARS